jgi:hypothetical protein
VSDAGVVLVAVGSSAVVAGVVSAILQAVLARRHERWQMTRATCLDALNVVDAVFANVDWRDHEGEILRQSKPSIADLRRVQNELALSCRNPDVLRHYRACIGLDGRLTADRIVDLRAAARRELGFGAPIDEDRATAFIRRVAQAAEAAGDD